MHTIYTNSTERVAELAEELRMLTNSGRASNLWTRSVSEALPKMIGVADLHLSEWAQIDWYGPLEQWRGPEQEVSDILHNGPSTDPFFVIQRGAMTNTGVVVHPTWLTWMQRQLLLRAGKLDPAGDGTWANDRALIGVADKLRYAITSQPYTRYGPSLSIRLLPERWRTLADLIQGGMITSEATEVLLVALRSGASVLVAGATGSGKTTLTAGFTQELGQRARMIFVEDGGELPRCMNSLHMEVDSQRIGQFSTAIKDTLRMKPDYVVVGEVRGAEAMAMLQAAATGHPGIGTIHATNAQAALRNLERMAMMGLASEASGGGQAAAQIVRGLITSDSVNLIVVYIDKTAQGRRTVMSIDEVLPAGAQGQSGDHFPTNTLFRYDEYSGTLIRCSNVHAKWGVGRY